MKHHYLKNVVTLQLDDDKCNGCGVCLNVCPHGVLGSEEKKVQIVDRNACMECGACAANCPFNAITVNAGVGCAAAIIKGALTGREPSCGCGENCC
jgi:NAD-dependent dihydropyrimidine dehydrogenase PreA subunit